MGNSHTNRSDCRMDETSEKQSIFDGSSFIFTAALNLIFLCQIKLNITFTNYFQDRKANLQIFIVNPIPVGLYLYKISLILPLRVEVVWYMSSVQLFKCSLRGSELKDFITELRRKSILMLKPILRTISFRFD